MQDSGMPIGHADRILHNLIAEVVGPTIDKARLYPASSHPDAECPRIVVPSRRLLTIA